MTSIVSASDYSANGTFTLTNGAGAGRCAVVTPVQSNTATNAVAEFFTVVSVGQLIIADITPSTASDMEDL